MIRWSLSLLFLVSCTFRPSFKDADLQKLFEKKTSISQEIDFNIEFKTKDDNKNLNSILFYKDSLNWRLEMTALLGIQVASVLKDSSQLNLLIPSEELLLIQNGEQLLLPGTQNQSIPIQKIMPWFYNDYSNVASNENFDFIKEELHFSETHEGEEFVFVLSELEFVDDTWVFNKCEILKNELTVVIKINSRKPKMEFSKKLWKLKYDEENTRIIYMMN